MPSSGICLPAITARSAARAAASACRSVTSRKALSCGSLVSIRASNSFTSSTGDNRFVAIRRPASATVRKGGVGPVIAHGGQACVALPLGPAASARPWLWPSPWPWPWPFADSGLRRRPHRRHGHGGADGRRQPEHTGHVVSKWPVMRHGRNESRHLPPGEHQIRHLAGIHAPARRARAEAASRRALTVGTDMAGDAGMRNRQPFGNDREP